MEEHLELSYADSNNSIPPPPPPMATVESLSLHSPGEESTKTGMEEPALPVDGEDGGEGKGMEEEGQQQEQQQDMVDGGEGEGGDQHHHYHNPHHQQHQQQDYDGGDDTAAAAMEEKMSASAVVVEEKEVRGDNCCERFLRCLSHVPCGSLISWILLVLGLGALTGSLLIGTQKCRDLLKMESFLWMMEYSVIGVVVSMLVLGTCFLIAGHLSTDPTSRRLFNSSSKNRCARGFNIFLLGLVYVLCLVWVLASTALATPIVLLGLMYLTTGDTLDLKYYGFPHYPDSPISGQELTNFKEDAMDVLICYGVSLLSAILVVISLVHFLICISANITHLKDNRFATLNAYETEELRNSKHSVLDTNM